MMIAGVKLPESLVLTARKLRPVYLGEQVAISTNGASSAVIGVLSSFKMTATKLPIENESPKVTIKVWIDGAKYDLESEQQIQFMNLQSEPGPL